MKRIKSMIVLLTMSACIGLLYMQATPSVVVKSPEAGEFVGSTPCDDEIKSLLKIPLSTTCDFIKWKLTIGPVNSPGFNLTLLYGVSQPNTNGFIGGGTKMNVEGKYTIVRSDAGLTYQLNSDGFQTSLLMVRIDNNLMHILNSKKGLMIGNGGWSYTLNKVNN